MANGFTRTQLRELVARVFGFHSDTATGGGTTTIVDTKLTRFANDFFNGAQAYIKTAGGADPETETAWVTDFVGSTGTLTVSPALSAAVQAGDTYQLYTRVSFDEINDALDKVVAGFEVATTLTAKSDSLDYYVASAPHLLRRQQIIGVWRRTNNDVRNLPTEVVGWQFEDAQGQLVLRMPYTMSTSDVIWLTYYASEHSLDDNTYVNLPMSLVRARAVVYLAENKLNNTTDRDWYGTLLRYWNERLTIEERQTQRAVKKARNVNWKQLAGGGAAFDTDQSWLGHILVDTGGHLIAE